MKVEPDISYGDEHVAFHRAIGSAVAQWAHVENGLFNVGLSAFGHDSKVFGPSFIVIENWRSKLAFVDQAIEFSNIFKPIYSDWVALRDRIGKLAVRRNKIVHGRTIGYPDAKVGNRYAIVPITYRTPKIKTKKAGPPQGSLCVSEIDLAARQFSRASTDLFDLKSRAEGYEGQFGERDLPELQALSVAEIVRQMHSMLQPHNHDTG